MKNKTIDMNGKGIHYARNSYGQSFITSYEHGFDPIPEAVFFSALAAAIEERDRLDRAIRNMKQRATEAGLLTED